MSIHKCVEPQIFVNPHEYAQQLKDTNTLYIKIKTKK